MAKPVIRRSRRCKHIHLSGRRCAIRVGRPVLLSAATGETAWVCHLHKLDTCEECDAMLQAFPIRKDAQVPF